MLTTQSFFNLADFPCRDLFSEDDYVWTPLNNLKEYLDNYNYPSYDSQLIKDGIPLREHVVIHEGKAVPAHNCEIIFGNTTKNELQINNNGRRLEGATVIMAGAVLTGNRISLGEGVLIECGAMIKSPAVIGDCCEVRQGAYLRGYVLTGKRCVLGHTTEIKHSIFLNDAKAGHFAYLGDSILGNNTNLGAGTKFANLRFLPGNLTLFHNGKRIDTGRRKFGAILGDDAQTGCNSVTNPGTIFGKGAILMPNATARAGYHSEKSILR
ncbi:MAG: bifunctional GlmU protein [Desulfobulbaceae bacterium S3730MH12]|nr:MAG: bifunctional GlmU protein [Desulfobulbaceae bacterium S5133MH15]OEU55269.1 MAG: bifunctional GlmU protein [Desulfobulbaceae bacterium S3730MH12]